MKKTFFFSLGLVVAFASLFISCSEDEIISDSKDKVSKHEAIDLGLPSGTKWATCNVGANSPEEYGGYYAWGETAEKSNYDWSTYKWCNGSENTVTKYCTSSVLGTVDNKTVLDPEDDVAHVKWGGSWRIPTLAEQEELFNNCSWTWTTLNGVTGYRVTGPNGNSIFLPAAGYRNGTDVYYRGSFGHCWSSSLNSYYSYYAYDLYFDDGNCYCYRNYRYYGQSVRPVCGGANYTVSVSCEGKGVVAIDGANVHSVTVADGFSITVTATANDGYEFIGWFVGDNETAVSTDAEYTFTVSENIALIAKFKEVVTTPTYKAIDLGLPSGLKWASFNVGANAPEEYGGYYAWGETEEKDDYSWSTYKWYNGSEDIMTKYCTHSDCGTVDNKTVLDPEDDVAHVKWGGSWRIPTLAEQEELFNNCSWTWTTLNGVTGYRVTGPNGNSIFLPAAGYRSDSGVFDRGSYGRYWSSSLYSYSSLFAFFLDFHDGYYDWDWCDRYYGQSVRPVTE